MTLVSFVFKGLSTKNKNSPPRRRAVLVGLRVCQRTFAFNTSSKQKNPNFLWEVGFGRRVRGSANGLNILGGILPSARNMSIANFHCFCSVCITSLTPSRFSDDIVTPPPNARTGSRRSPPGPRWCALIRECGDIVLCIRPRGQLQPTHAQRHVRSTMSRRARDFRWSRPICTCG